MDCKKCKWLKIYNYKFPDGTKTMSCEKFKKHLGFTDKKGNFKTVKAIAECELNNAPRKVEVKEEPLLKGRLIQKNSKWAVEVEEHGITSVIYTSRSYVDALDKLNLFRHRKSWIKGLCYAKKYGRWTVKLWNNKTLKYIGTYKTFLEAKKALKQTVH